jgi:hypothetical protein
MTAMTPASAPDVVPAARSMPIPSVRPADGHIGTLLHSLTASWRPAAIVVERRSEHRVPCDLPAVLVPLDNQGNVLTSAALDIRIKDLSGHGIGIAHPQPMPHRLVLVAFESTDDGPIRLVVRLKWCRFKKMEVYESGGQFLKVLRSGERLTPESEGPEDTRGGTLC